MFTKKKMNHSDLHPELCEDLNEDQRKLEINYLFEKIIREGQRALWLKKRQAGIEKAGLAGKNNCKNIIQKKRNVNIVVNVKIKDKESS